MIEYNYEPTQINKIDLSNENNYYIKRDDLIPFSFGGNKVRIAFEFVNDMLNKKCDCMIAYGSSKSNLCRVISNLCKKMNIDCYVISSLDDSCDDYNDTSNSKLVKRIVNDIIVCSKSDVANTINEVKQDLIKKGYKPYYIYDKQNEKVAFNAYIKAFNEILQYEKKNNIFFDYIFLCSGTGMTQTGIILGAMKNTDTKFRNIIGISNARYREKGIKILEDNIRENTDNQIVNSFVKYDFLDNYICGGYGLYNKNIIDIVKKIYDSNGIPLDLTYTGKAFWGMCEYIKKEKIMCKNILFIHTGGTPLFFDDINKISN